MSAPPALVSVPPAAGTSSGAAQSSDTEQNPPKSTSPHELKLSPKSEHHGYTEDSKILANKRNRKPEEHLTRLDLDSRTSQTVEATEADQSKSQPDKPLQASVAFDHSPSKKWADSEKHLMCRPEDSISDQKPARKSSHLHKVEDSADEERMTFNDSSQFGDYSSLTTLSRIDDSSVLEKSSLVEDESSRADESTRFDNGFHLRKNSSRVDSTSHTGDEATTAFDTTRDSISSVECSRDETLDSTREGETSEAEETKDSCQTTSDSLLESSLNNTSQMEEPSVDSSDVSKSRSFVPSQPSCTGTVLQLMIMQTIIT